MIAVIKDAEKKQRLIQFEHFTTTLVTLSFVQFI